MYRIIYSTNNSIDNIKEITNYLLSNKLAACINIIPNVQSFYIWNDQIESDEEYIMIVKTIKDNTEKVIKAIESRHIAECPAILCIDVDNGSQKFLNWIDDNCIKKI